MNHKDVTAKLLVCTLSFLMTMLLIGTITNYAIASPPAGYGLTWSDEFNGAVGSQANPANWTYDLGYGASNFGNDEQETYTNSSANSHIVSDPNATDGLALQIIALNNNGNITSARLKSLGLHTVQYGYIESRIEAFNPSGDQGIWPAWWMMGENMPSVGWPNCGEIDIMEQWDGENQNNMSIHGPNMTGDSLTTNGPTNCWINQYHVYGLLWTPTNLTYYVDGVQEASYSQSSSPSWPFNQPFFYLLNIAVGGSGSFTGAWNGSTTWPQTMNVDYIREYQPGAGASFTDTATASPASVAVNSPVTITETAKDTGAATSGALIDCEVYNSSGTLVNQQYTTGQTFSAGQPQQYAYTWTPSAAGTYTVKVGVYSANWASNYVYNTNAATVTATAGAATFTDTATASPASVAVNSPVTITETAKDTGSATSGALIDCEVYNSSGTMVFQNYTTGQTFSAGQSQQYTYTWTPTTAGTYTVHVGVFSANWASNYVYNSNAASVTVTSAVQSGTYNIISVQTGLALDGGPNTSGTNPWLYGLNNSPDQQWQIAPSGSGYSIISVQSGLALDGGANTSGTHPQLFGSNGTPDQQWQLAPSGSGYSITSVQSGLLLDGGANTSGTYPLLDGSDGATDQQWKLVVE